MIKIAIVGCGYIANTKHMPALKKLPDVEMIAFCDTIPERADKAAADYGAPGAKVYTNYKEIMGRKDIDVVHVLTPNSTHAEISIASMESGKHVMCEKPMAKTAEDARAMNEVHKRTGKLLTIGFNGRCEVAQLYARQLVEDGALGDIYYTRATAMRRRGVPCWGVFLNKGLQGGGAIIDSHCIDNIMWMAGNHDVMSVTASTFSHIGTARLANPANGPGMGTWDPDEFEVEDSAFAFVKFHNGMVMDFSVTWAVNIAEDLFGTMLLCGTKGGLDFKDGLRVNGEANGQLYLNKIELWNHQRPRRIGVSMTGGEYEAWQWIEAVKGNGTPLVKPEEALVTTEIQQAMYASARTGKTIEFQNGRPINI